MKSKLLKIPVIIFFLSNLTIAGDLKTHLETSDFAELTSYEQMMTYIHDLEKISPFIDLQIIGSSVEGREIPALFISSGRTFAQNRTKKPVVLIICQQHGDEPSGKEAALIVARLLNGSERKLIDQLDIILVPQVNPDGSERGQRNNARGMDLNRNHVILSESESFAIHNLFLDWMPEVTLDVHEYNAIKKNWIEAGFIKDADEMLGGISNKNIEPSLIEFSQNIFIPATGKKIEENGYRFHRYIVGSPFGNERIRYSTTSITDARQSMGIYNTLSFIIEGKRYGNLLNEVERRTKGQVFAMISFLQTVAENRESVSDLVEKARSTNHSKNTEVFIQMDYFADSGQPTLKFPVFDLFTWSHTTRDLENLFPIVKVKKSVKKPYAYIFAEKEIKLIELLKKHRIPLFTLLTDTKLQVESYRILHVTPCTDEDKPALCIDSRKEIYTKTFHEGDIIVKLDNRAVHLIPLLLEPESSWGIVTERGTDQYRFGDYLKEDSIYPIRRIQNEEDVPQNITELLN